MKKQHLFTVTALVALMSLGGALALPALAQVAGGTTTVAVAVTESTELAMGWSVKKTLMGKTLYNEAGTKIGKVEDLIVSPARSVIFAGETTSCSTRDSSSLSSTAPPSIHARSS